MDQCQSIGSLRSPERPRSCERGQVWQGPLDPEFTRSVARRGSASVIDTLRANQIAQLHALLNAQNKRSISPTFSASGSSNDSEAEDGFPGHQTPSQLTWLPPGLKRSESRRHSDTSTVPLGGRTDMSAMAPGRRHSDLSSLLSVHSQHQLQQQRGGRMCHVCLHLLMLRTQEVGRPSPSYAVPAHHCLCALQQPQHQNPSGATAFLGTGGPKDHSDSSDFSVLQQSLLNIISRKSAPSHVTASHVRPLLPPPSP